MVAFIYGRNKSTSNINAYFKNIWKYSKQGLLLNVFCIDVYL